MLAHVAPTDQNASAFTSFMKMTDEERKLENSTLSLSLKLSLSLSIRGRDGTGVGYIMKIKLVGMLPIRLAFTAVNTLMKEINGFAAEEGSIESWQELTGGRLFFSPSLPLREKAI